MAIDYMTYIQNLRKNITDTTQRPSYTVGATANAESIRNQYQNSLQAELAKRQAEYNNALAGYQKQVADAPQAYQGLRNDAYTQNAIQQRQLRERMANLGLSGAGGQSLTLENNQRANLLNTVGEANRQQQAFIDNANLQMGNLQNTYNADIAALRAQYEAQQAQALQNDYYNQLNADLQTAQAAQSMAQGQFEQAYNLYLRGAITPAQFEAMTGIKVQKLKSSSKPKASTSNIEQDLLDLFYKENPNAMQAPF
jgi:hypothetical protein